MRKYFSLHNSIKLTSSNLNFKNGVSKSYSNHNAIKCFSIKGNESLGNGINCLITQSIIVTVTKSWRIFSVLIL